MPELQLSAVSYQPSAGGNATPDFLGCTAGALVGEIAAAPGAGGGAREARELLSLVWDVAPGWISVHADAPVPRAIRAAALAAAGRRAAGMPLQYAARRAAFRHLLLEVDERVLIPRPETEIVVDEALAVCSAGVAVDVGTGSGAIALALATEGAFTRVFATDISTDALAVAARNTLRHDRRGIVELRAGSLLAPVRDIRADLIVANPPYVAVPELHSLPGAVRDWEPPVALLSGRAGLAHSFSLIEQAASVLAGGGWLVLEADSGRAGAVAHYIAALPVFTEVRVRPDLTGRDRVVVARRRQDANRGISA